MVLRFSCRGQTYKFNVSPPTTVDGCQPVEKVHVEISDKIINSMAQDPDVQGWAVFAI